MKTNSITGGADYQLMIDFAKLLRSDCTRYLNDSDTLERGSLFRMMKPNTHIMKEVLVNTARMPRDTPLSLHTLIDNYFFEKYSIPFRSASVFCVNSPVYITNEYPASNGVSNALHVIFPIGNYSCISSTKYRDLLLILQNSYKKHFVEFTSTDNLDDISDVTKQKIIDFLDRGDYVLNDLFGNGANEIMLYCKSYYALDISGKNYTKMRYLHEILSTK